MAYCEQPSLSRSAGSWANSIDYKQLKRDMMAYCEQNKILLIISSYAVVYPVGREAGQRRKQ